MFQPVLDAVPDTFDIEGVDARPTVIIPLAASEDGYQFIAVEVRLWPHYWSGVACHQFKFAIVVLDDAEGEPAEIFDRNMAAGYVESVRDLIMPCVCAAARHLVDAIRPPVIFRATYLTRPPEKSLPKHQMITDNLVSLGYEEAQAGTDVHGRIFWLMTKEGEAR